MALLEYQELATNRNNAANLLKKSINSRAQLAQVNTDLLALKVEIKNDVDANIWKKNKFIRAGRLLVLRDALIQRMPIIKTELVAMKPLLKDLNFEEDLQNESDLI